MSEQTISRIPAAQDALKAQLDTAFTGLTPKVQISLGPPTADATEQVWVHGDVPEWEIRADTLGGADVGIDDEAFTLIVCVRTRDYRTFLAGRTRLFALLQRVKNAIHADLTLGGSVLYAHLAGGPITEETESDRYVFGSDVRIVCEASLVV